MAPKPAKIVYCPMEIASRELDSRLLLTAIAAARGFEVVLGQKWLIERNIERMTPGIYLSKTLTVRDAKMLKRARAAGYITAAVDEEIPGLVVHDKNFWWVSRDAVDATDVIFLPGTFNSRAFLEAFGLEAGRVKKAANPRWDLLRRELRTIFAEEADALRRRHGEFILLNSNLGFTNSHKGNIDEIIQSLVDQGKVDPNNHAFMAELREFGRMESGNRAALLELLPALAQAFPHYKIVVRPHPSENVEAWQEWTRGIPNLSVIREGSATAWIMASQVLVHTNCSTGTEAVALDRPAVCLVPTDSPANRRYLANLVNPVAKTAREALEAVASFLSEPARCYTREMIDRYRDTLSYDDKWTGAEQIISGMEELAAARGGWSASGEGMSAWHPSLGYRWHQADKNVRGTLFPELDLVAVERRLKQFSEILGLDTQLNIEGCGTKVALISPRGLPLTTRIRRAVGRW
ncbi:surface carbohydrate biosynthesis protein [Dongia deserti]|uniref:surface carbohydrate biosynthesis protein n=1 Tax=Dongia deserti TaxID=2268030 RepID=UPI000E656FF5|nr:surface carbohydrate biosynthesis protein [Dongia deserti]